MPPKRPPATIPMERLRIRTLDSLQPLLTLALDEDIGPGDLTSDVLIDTRAAARGELLVKADGVVAGLLIVPPILQRVDSRLQFKAETEDGSPVARGTVLGCITGPVRRC